MDEWREFVERQVELIGPPFWPMEPGRLDSLATQARKIERLDDPTLALGQTMARRGEFDLGDDDPESAAATDRLVEAIVNRVLRKRYGGRPSDTDEERREFLEGVHRQLFGKGLDTLGSDTLAVVMKTMADAAILSDEGVMARWDQQQQLVDAGAVGIMDTEGPFDPDMSQAALQLLRAVLRREMRLRGLTPPDGQPLNDAVRSARGRLLDGMIRRRALAAVR